MSQPPQVDGASSPSHTKSIDLIEDASAPATSAGDLTGSKRNVSWWQVPAAMALLAAAAVVTYWNSFRGPFVFDDRTWIVDNPTIRQLWPPGPLLFPPSTVLTGGRPVLSLSLAINYVLGGTEVWGYHAVNLAIHILAAWTLFGVVRRTLLLPQLRDRFAAAPTPLALAIAVIWAVHPLQTAAVTYIVQRNEALVGLFYLLTLYCVIRGATAASSARNATGPKGCPVPCHSPLTARLSSPKSTHHVLWYAGAFVACLMGMLTKEVMATAPLVVLLYDRTFLSGTFREALKQRWKLYVALAATWTAVVWELISTDFHSGTAGFGIKQFTPWSYLLTEPDVIVHYLETAFWPAGLSLDYAWAAATTVGEIVPAGLLVVALLAVTCWAVVKSPAWGFLGAWFFLILAPTSSFIPIQDAAFDHRMYLPLAAVISAVVMAIFIVGRRCSLGRPATAAASLIAVGIPTVALAWSTIERNEVFRSEAAIWLDKCDKRPNNARALKNAGEALNALGQSDRAIEYYRRAINADPIYVPAINNLAGALFDRRDAAGAIALYDKALAIKPDDQWVTINLAKTLSLQGKLAEAAERCGQALRLNPDFAQGHVVMAGILLRQGQAAKAVEECSLALRLKPDLPEGHYELANMLAMQGKLAEAIPHLQQAAEESPNDLAVRERLAMALGTLGRTDESLAELRKIVEANPNHVAAHFHLGSLLARKGDWGAAIAEWRLADRLQPDSPTILSRLAMGLAACPDEQRRNGGEALQLAERAMRLNAKHSSAVPDPDPLDAAAAANAELGRFDEAAKLAEQAMNAASHRNNQALAAQIADRLSFYLRRMPYRETQGGQVSGEW